MEKIFVYLKVHYIISIIIAAVIIVAGIGTYYLSGQSSKLETVLAVRQSISQSVAVTGSVKPSIAVDLAFEKSGTVGSVNADVGAEVKTGDLIVSLKSSDLVADLDQAQAALLKEQVKLNNLKAGNRPEDIAISGAQLDNAKATVTSAESSAVNAITDAYSKSDDAVRYHTDKFFNNPRSFYPTLIFGINDADLGNKIQQMRVDSEQLLKDFLIETQGLSGNTNIASALEDALVKINKIKSFLDTLAIGVNSVLANVSNISQATVDGYKADMSAARADVFSAISEVTTAQNALNNALTAQATVQSQFDLQKAGNTSSDINAQAAQVQSQIALVEIKQAALAKNFLRAPIDGVVSKQDAKIGQIAPAGVPVVSVISNKQFQIEANIPEANISKVHVGDDAKVTLDAYPDGTTFDASLIKIDPAETVVDGVPTYKITFEFKKVDDRIRSGMTANVNIISIPKDNAIVVPERAIYSDVNGNYVRVLNNGTTETVRVQTGIHGSNGLTEIVQGLSGGESIIVSP